MIDSDHPALSIARQCQLLSISRSGFYYQPSGESELNLTLMRLIDEQHMRTPYYGARQMARYLRREGYVVSRKRVRRLMQKMGLCVVYQRPRTTVPAVDHEVYPYLLRDLVSAITGQSREMVEHYALQVNQRKLAAAAILKWEAATQARTENERDDSL